MNFPGSRGGRRKGLRALVMAAVIAGLFGQIVPFLPAQRAGESYLPAEGAIPAQILPWYGPEDLEKAEEFHRPLTAASLAASFTVAAGLALLWLLGAGRRLEERLPSSPLRWAGIVLFLAGLSIFIYLLSRPFNLFLYRHSLAFGLTQMRFPQLLGSWSAFYALSLSLFVLRGTLIICLMALFPRRWWIAAPLGVFLLFGLLPELITRPPKEPVVQLSPLRSGEYRRAIEEVGARNGTSLEIMVSDAGRREETVNVELGGRAAARYLVITDTFLEHFSPAEAAVAVGHELGHLNYQARFLSARKAILLLQLLIVFFLGFRISVGGAKERFSPLHTIVLLVFLSQAAGLALRPAGSALSRVEERLADRTSLQLTGDCLSFTSLLAKGAHLNLELLDFTGPVNGILSDYPSLRKRMSLFGDCGE
jgi:Zn-dependent protease with chaperone function